MVLCRSQSGHQVAIKGIKNQMAYFQQAKIEIRLLLQSKSEQVVQLEEFFMFHNHLFLVFEVLAASLHDMTRLNGYQGLPLLAISRIVRQVLLGLETLHAQDIIHCDLKPENILFTDGQQERVKIIDLGSSCLSQQVMYTYIQSRFYRAPEISLGLPYDHKIDLWSLGCIAVELFLGLPIFPANSQYDLVKRQFQILASRYIDSLGLDSEGGVRIDRLIEESSHGGKFFKRTTDFFGDTTYQLKSMSEYQESTGIQQEGSYQYFDITRLEDLGNYVDKSQFRDNKDTLFF